MRYTSAKYRAWGVERSIADGFSPPYILLSYNAVGEARGEATVHTSCDLSLPAVLVVSLCVYKADSARWCKGGVVKYCIYIGAQWPTDNA